MHVNGNGSQLWSCFYKLICVCDAKLTYLHSPSLRASPLSLLPSCAVMCSCLTPWLSLLKNAEEGGPTHLLSQHWGQVSGDIAAERLWQPWHTNAEAAHTRHQTPKYRHIHIWKHACTHTHTHWKRGREGEPCAHRSCRKPVCALRQGWNASSMHN